MKVKTTKSEHQMFFGWMDRSAPAVTFQPTQPVERKPTRRLGHRIREAGLNGRLRIKSGPQKRNG